MSRRSSSLNGPDSSASQNPNKRGYHASASTKAYLQEVWKTTAYPTAEEYEAIAAHVGDRSVGQLKVWFKGQRKKRSKIARESGLPSPAISTARASPSEPGAGSDDEDDEEELLFPELVASPEFTRLQQLIRKCPNPSEKKIDIWLRVLKVENLAEMVALWIQWKQEQDDEAEEEGDGPSA